MNDQDRKTDQTKENIDKLVEIGSTLVDVVSEKSSIKSKLRSRKFWLTMVGVIVGICGIIGFNDNTTAIIAFSVLELGSIIGYCG